MAFTVAQKIIKAHLVKGEMISDLEIAIKIDQTLTQDSTGTMAYLQFEAMGIHKVQTKRSVAYIGHNILQTGPENADDHLYIQTVAKKHGIYFSKPGNGICHQVHLERFAVPGETLLGSDSHTPTCGGIGMLAIGAGGLDVAVAMGQSPSTDVVSLRTFNRNFKGRYGTVSANVYIVSPEVAAASALTGYITDPRELGEIIKVPMPEKFLINDNLIISPAQDGKDIEIKRGTNIKPFPKVEKLKDDVEGKVLIKLEDNITTDHIMPSNAKLLPFRSNIPYLSEFCLTPCDENFPTVAKENGGGIIIAGSNYGQGSSREHAALAPLYLGIKAVIAKFFARIHKANLINNAIIPLIFENTNDYEEIDVMDELIIEDVAEQIKKDIVIVRNITKGVTYKTLPEVTEREKDMLIYGGLINLIKNKKKVGE